MTRCVHGNQPCPTPWTCGHELNQWQGGQQVEGGLPIQMFEPPLVPWYRREPPWRLAGYLCAALVLLAFFAGVLLSACPFLFSQP